MGIEVVLSSVLFGVLGAIGGLVFKGKEIKKIQDDREQKGDEIVEKAKKKANDIRHNAKRDAKQIVQEERQNLEKEFKARQNDLSNQERTLAKKEATLDQKIESNESKAKRLEETEGILSEKQKKAEAEAVRYREAQSQIAEKLEQVAGMTRDEAKTELINAMVEEAKVDGAMMIRRVEEEAQEEAEKKSKRVMSIAIQRFAGEFVAEPTIASVELPSDEIKGRLIGREGRNIRAFEQICGVDLVIDDTPGIVVVSSFNVVRKEIARLTIERLIADGRIHPAKIEEFYEKSKVELDSRLRELGEKAQMEIGVHGIHPEILKLIGALNYRTSYTQNQYQHALEAAFICGNMAAEFGLNVKQARRAGLMHDIGKVLDASAEGSHAVVGADFAKIRRVSRCCSRHSGPS